MLALIITACGGEGASSEAQEKLDAYCAEQELHFTGETPLEGDPDLEGTLTIWGWYNPVPEALVEDFKKLYPNVKFDFVDFSNPDTHTKLLTALNSATGAPDISMVQERDGPRFWNLGLLDLRECVGPYKSAFPEYKWSKIVTPDDKIRAVP